MTKLTRFISKLKKANYHKIYLSHEPWQEQEARQFAEKLRNQGFTVIVAADARPHKDNPHDRADLEIVRRVIKSCDVLIVYGEGKNIDYQR